MLSHNARLADLKVIKVWCGYSTTIGNLAFPLTDTCAATAKIARRGLAASTGHKKLLLALIDEVARDL